MPLRGSAISKSLSSILSKNINSHWSKSIFTIREMLHSSNRWRSPLQHPTAFCSWAAVCSTLTHRAEWLAVRLFISQFINIKHFAYPSTPCENTLLWLAVQLWSPAVLLTFSRRPPETPPCHCRAERLTDGLFMHSLLILNLSRVQVTPHPTRHVLGS